VRGWMVAGPEAVQVVCAARGRLNLGRVHRAPRAHQPHGRRRARRGVVAVRRVRWDDHGCGPIRLGRPPAPPRAVRQPDAYRARSGRDRQPAVPCGRASAGSSPSGSGSCQARVARQPDRPAGLRCVTRWAQICI